MLHFFKQYNKPVITILHEFHRPPWGGGNQFLLALKKGFEKKGYLVTNTLEKNAAACIFNSFTFDTTLFKNFNKANYPNTTFVHRVDGPTILVRGKDQELDDMVFEINKWADVTVFQSKWSYNKTLELGYKPVNPVIIMNTVDAEIFNMKDRIEFDKDRKIKLISTSWSDNMRKGFEVYRWLDNNLDFSKYDYTFVGRSPFHFSHIHMVPAQDSIGVAKYLKQHDIYITASQNEPCSNALLEALCCGLPALYYRDGSHQESVKRAGMGFEKPEDIPTLLNKIVNSYEVFQKSLNNTGIDTITEKYLKLFIQKR